MTNQQDEQYRQAGAELAHMSDEAIRSAQDGENTRQFLSFTLGEEEYGVDIMQVREVKGWSNTTRLPNAPDYVRGVLNLRGMILPVYDLRMRFSGEWTEVTPTHVNVIIAVGGRTIGLLADAVSDIITVESSEVKPAPDAYSASADSRFIHGLIALERRMVVLLDVERLISAEETDKLLAQVPAETASKTQTQHSQHAMETSS